MTRPRRKKPGNAGPPGRRRRTGARDNAGNKVTAFQPVLKREKREGMGPGVHILQTGCRKPGDLPRTPTPASRAFGRGPAKAGRKPGPFQSRASCRVRVCGEAARGPAKPGAGEWVGTRQRSLHRRRGSALGEKLSRETASLWRHGDPPLWLKDCRPMRSVGQLERLVLEWLPALWTGPPRARARSAYWYPLALLNISKVSIERDRQTTSRRQSVARGEVYQGK